MGNREAWKVVPVGKMSARDMDFARRQGIIKDPDFRNSNVNNPGLDNVGNGDGWQDLGSADVMPAANIKSGWNRVVETRTGRVKDLS